MTSTNDRTPALEDGYDLNLLNGAGSYVVVSPENGPIASTFFVTVFAANIQGNFRTLQIAADVATGNEYARTRTAAGWSGWIAYVTGSVAADAALLSGNGAPDNALGKNGDFYIDTLNDFIYGPKNTGVWPAGKSLVGPQGPAGAQGAAGPAGPQGPQGLQGPAGAGLGGGVQYDSGRDVLSFVKDTGTLWEVAASALADGVPFNFTQGTTPWTNGPAGQTNYNDDVVAWGFNIAAPNVKIVSGEPAGWLSFERKYWQSGRFVAEYHLSHNGTNNSEIRLWSFLAAHDGSHVSGMATTSQLSFQGVTGGEFLQFDWQTAGQGRLKFASGTQIQAQFNNVPWMQQLNAAGNSYITGPYLNASNQWLFSAGVYVVNGVAGTPSFDAVASSLSAGQAIFRAQGTLATAGNIDVLNAVMQVNGGLRGVIQNNGNYANAGAEIRLHALYGQSGADTKLVWENFGVGGTASAFAAGIDQSDGAKWKLSRSNALGTNDVLIADANKLEAALPFKLKSYTVGTLPDAATAGAGAMIFVSNESGGAVPAFSDGTSWLRVTDRVVVS